MNPALIFNYVLRTFDDVRLINTWGEASFFYNRDNLHPRGTYFCTVKEKDGDNDKASALSRESVFRLSFGIAKSTFMGYSMKFLNGLYKRVLSMVIMSLQI